MTNWFGCWPNQPCPGQCSVMCEFETSDEAAADRHQEETGHAMWIEKGIG